MAVGTDDTRDVPEHDFFGMKTDANMMRRWGRRVGGVNVVELDDLTMFLGLTPERKLLMLALLLVLKDRASALEFEPGPFDARQTEAFVGEVGLKMFYVVDGERIELIPPPPSFKDRLTQEIQQIASLSTWRRRVADRFRRIADGIDGQIPMPRQGHVCLKCGEFQVETELLEYRTEHGPHLILNLAPQPDSLSERAQAVIMSIISSRKEQCGGPEREASL